MTVWTWVLGGPPPSGLRRRQLTKATGRTVTWRLDANATAQFSISGRSDEALEVQELATDLTVYRDSLKVFRGRIGPESDDIGPGKHSCQFTATDYRGMLGYRFTGASGAYYPPGSIGGDIVMDLIDTSQARDGGDWGLTPGVGATVGTTREKSIDPGKPIDESINELARLDDGYEWEIDAELAVNLWHPTRGVNNGVVLDYRGLISRVRRLLDPKDFANAVLATGSQGLTPADDDSAGISLDPRGRWEHAVGYPSITEQTSLAAKAPWLLEQTSTLRPTYSVTFRPGRWGGPTHVWLGDTVILAVNSGRLNFADPYRVVEISAQPGENGTETVAMGLLAA